MGQSLKKLSSGHDEKTIKKISEKIEECYTKHYKDDDPQNSNFADFYSAVSETVEEINKLFDNTQVKVPTSEKLKTSYRHRTHHEHGDEPVEVTKEEFQKILQELLITDARFTGVGAKDILIYIFGVPLTAFLVKQGLFPGLIRNEIFIPGVTSATVFALAKLNKI